MVKGCANREHHPRSKEATGKCQSMGDPGDSSLPWALVSLLVTSEDYTE